VLVLKRGLQRNFGEFVQMKLVRNLLVFSVVWSSSFSYAFENGTYLHQVIEDPMYLAAWNKLFEKTTDVDDWLKEYSVTLDGVQSQVLKMEFEGSRYEVFKVCKPHDCGDNQFAVIFFEKERGALGLLVKSRYVRVYNTKETKFQNRRVTEKTFFGEYLFNDPIDFSKIKSVLLKAIR